MTVHRHYSEHSNACVKTKAVGLSTHGLPGLILRECQWNKNFINFWSRRNFPLDNSVGSVLSQTMLFFLEF